MSLFEDLYKYREFLKTNVQKDIRGKYKGSFLGVLWSFINPLLSVLVYAIVFSQIMRFDIDNYVIYLITGVLPWTYFTSSINMGMTSVIYNANIIKKVYFPRSILPISSVSSCLVNFLISCLVILVFVLFSGIGISIHILWLPLIALIQYFFCLGITFILSAIEVFVRDLEHIINFVLSMAFYVTPILYKAEQVPESLRFILKLNPMAYIIDAYRDVFYYGVMPNIGSLLLVMLVSILIMLLGYKTFDKLQRGFAEEV